MGLNAASAEMAVGTAGSGTCGDQYMRGVRAESGERACSCVRELMLLVGYTKQSELSVRQRTLPNSMVSTLLSVGRKVVEESSSKNGMISPTIPIPVRSYMWILAVGRWRAGVLRGAGRQQRNLPSNCLANQSTPRREQAEGGTTRESA